MTAVIVPYSLLRFMDKIDNIWDIGMHDVLLLIHCENKQLLFAKHPGTERADSAGKMMAHVLLKRPQASAIIIFASRC